MASWFARLPVERRRHLLVWLLAVVVGCLVFFAWIGYARTLDPTNLRWIWHEDPFTHVMGWEQYRNAPLLQYPITKNHLYGLEWSSTVVFTDSIPLAALVLRPFSALLPHPFQYLGWWVLLSLILQAYFGARLVLLRSDRLRDAAIGSIFFVTTPVLLERLGLQTGVGTHWLILWALLLYLSQRGAASRAWAALLLLTVTVHAYLFVMVGAIWIAHLVACRLRGSLSRRDLGYAAATLVVVVVWMHVLGYFLVGDGAAAGGWRSNFDLLGFISPSRGARLGLVRSVYNDPWDGSTYLGAGLLLLLLASGAAALWRRRSSAREAAPAEVRWLPLVVIVLGLAAFAITGHITAGGKSIAWFRLPHAFDGLYATFRGAARMVWPAYYLIMTATLWLALRAWPARAVGWVLAAAVAVQLVDLEGDAAFKRDEIRGGGITRPLADPIWSTIAQHYHQIVSVPARHRQPDWPTFAWFAARNGLGSNIGYLSRSNPEARAAGARANLDAVSTGKYDPGTVYYFPSTSLWTVARQTMGPQDLAIVADGFHLVVPGGRAWVKEPTEPAPTDAPRLGTWMPFSDADAGSFLIDGWGWPENWGTWSSGKHAWLVLPVPPHERVRVSFKWLSYAPLHKQQTVHVHLDRQTFDVTFPRRGVARQDTFEITTSSRLLDVHIDIDRPREKPPQSELGVGLIAARVQLASDPVDDGVPEAAHGAPVLDSWTDFTDKGAGRALLAHGWSWGESWGTWSEDVDPALAVPVPPDEHLQLTLRWTSTAPKGQRQAARVFVDDKPFDIEFPGNDKAIESTFDVTSQRGWVMVRLDIAHPVEVKDGRLLGVGIEAVRVVRVPH